jgi:hypothetical protein
MKICQSISSARRDLVPQWKFTLKMEALFHVNVSLIPRGPQGMLSQNKNVSDSTCICAKYLKQP